MHHTVVYRGTVGATSNNVSIPIIPGSGDTVQNNMFFPSEDMSMIAAYAMGANMSRIRVVTPSLQAVAPYYLNPFVNAAAVPTNPNFDWELQSPIPLAFAEQIDVQSSNSAGAGETHTAVLFFQRGASRIPAGKKYRTRATGTTTLNAGAWTVVTPTFEATLPNGVYEVIGLIYVGATAVAARLIFPDLPWRPGVLGRVAVGNRDPYQLLENRIGSFGKFRTFALPQVECFAIAADTAQEFYFDLVRVS